MSQLAERWTVDSAWVVFLLPLAWLTGCHSEAHQHAAPPPQAVVVSQPLEREVTDFSDFTGRTDAVQSVDIRARVTGYLTKMPFKEGDEVKKGDLLFEIDPRPYQAAADQAKANVLSNQAQVNLAAITYARYQKLAQTPNAVSQQDLDQYRTNVDSAKAAMLAAEAAQRTADLNLEFTQVTSPVDGQVSRYYLTLGNLATQDQTLLTTVVSLDPMYAYFDVDEATVLHVRREINAGRIQPRTERREIPVLMGLQGEQGFPHEGLMTFVNNKIDPSTGTIMVRGTFSNPKPDHGTRLLSPGMFVRIRLPIGPPHQAQLVADEAVGTDQGLKFLYVVNDQNKVEYRTVTLGALQEDGLRVVEPGSKPGEGIKPGEWVVTAGLQLIQQGMTVKPERKLMQIPAPEQDQSPKSSTAPADAGPKPVQPRS